MNTQTSTTTNDAANVASIHPDTDLGLVALAVSDLAAEREFYEQVMGFRTISATDELSSTLGS